MQEIDRKYPITSGYFILTENCNLRCRYCFEGDTRDISKKMTEETAFRGIDFLFENARYANHTKRKNEVHITFFGGEPMLCTDMMIRMLEHGYARSKELNIPVRFSIITNGTIYTDKVERFLETWYGYAGTLDIQLSYDGLPEVQNANRPCADYSLKSSELLERAVEGYKGFYKSHGISLDRLHIHSVVTKKSIPLIFDSYVYFTKTLGLLNSNFAWLIEDDWDDNDLMVFDKQMMKVTDYLLERTSNLQRFPFKHFDKTSGCSCGRYLVCFDTDGNIYPCHRFFFYSNNRNKKFIFGNLHHEEPILNQDLREEFCRIDLKNIKCRHPCQICVACNYEYTDSFYQRPNCYDENFMQIINYYERDFRNICMMKQQSEKAKNLADKLIRKGGEGA